MSAISLLASPIADLVGKVVDHFWPDPTTAAQAKAALLSVENAPLLQNLDDEYRIAVSQLDVNKAEASNPNIFVSGWRPFIGWVCGTSFAYSFVIHPVIGDVATISGDAVTLPTLDMTTMTPVLLGMLGLGVQRTYERIKGVAKGQTDTEMPSYQPIAPVKKK